MYKFLLDRSFLSLPFMEADGGGAGVKDQEAAEPDTNVDEDEFKEFDDEADERFYFDDDEDSEEEDDTNKDDEDNPTDDKTDDKKPGVQSDDKNAIYAEARRVAEAQANAKVQAALSQMDDLAKKNGFESWNEMQADTEKRKIEAEKGKIIAENADDPLATIEKLIDLSLSNNSVIKQIEEHKKEAEARSALNFAEDATRVLSEKYPQSGVKTFQDVYALENGPEIIELFTKGVPLVDAYALKNMEKISSQQLAAVKQKTLNQMNDKSHMQGTHQTGGTETSDVTVPDETLRYYHDLFPKWSKKEIVAHYTKTTKMSKG